MFITSYVFVCLPGGSAPSGMGLGYQFMLYSSPLQIKKLANSNRLFHFCSTTNPPVQRKDCHCKACTLSSNQQALALKSSLLKSKTIQIHTLILNSIIIAQRAHFVNELFTLFLQKFMFSSGLCFWCIARKSSVLISRYAFFVTATLLWPSNPLNV